VFTDNKSLAIAGVMVICFVFIVFVMLFLVFAVCLIVTLVAKYHKLIRIAKHSFEKITCPDVGHFVDVMHDQHGTFHLARLPVLLDLWLFLAYVGRSPAHFARFHVLPAASVLTWLPRAYQGFLSLCAFHP